MAEETFNDIFSDNTEGRPPLFGSAASIPSGGRTRACEKVANSACEAYAELSLYASSTNDWLR
jgi:hypothetical protein